MATTAPPRRRRAPPLSREDAQPSTVHYVNRRVQPPHTSNRCKQEWIKEKADVYLEARAQLLEDQQEIVEHYQYPEQRERKILDMTAKARGVVAKSIQSQVAAGEQIQLAKKMIAEAREAKAEADEHIKLSKERFEQVAKQLGKLISEKAEVASERAEVDRQRAEALQMYREMKESHAVVFERLEAMGFPNIPRQPPGE